MLRNALKAIWKSLVFENIDLNINFIPGKTPKKARNKLDVKLTPRDFSRDMLLPNPHLLVGLKRSLLLVR